ncbi:DUF2651 family protein [Bacillus mojavensis]|uniref:DUF2651 family protein n=1 Tax=Bacillus mojavensis TaxID=72360 RepID=UPI00256F5FB4|nr:DUF2651 family protein [Bacillus mojavensis]
MDKLDIAFGILPLVIIVLSVAGTYVCKNVYMMPLVSLIISLVLTFTVFNQSFLGIWKMKFSSAFLTYR